MYLVCYLIKTITMDSYNHSIVDIYIPRMLGNVSTTIVKNTFQQSKIGRVVDLDMHRKKNENGYYYFFAFVKLQLMHTEEASRLSNLLNERGIMHLVYDEEACQYWEIKKHIPKSHRTTTSNSYITDMSSRIATNVSNLFNNASDELPRSGYDICNYKNADDVYCLTQQDRIDMVNEYEDLQREIYKFACNTILPI